MHERDFRWLFRRPYEPDNKAAYWAGMAIHRRHPRRVLVALCILLTDGLKARETSGVIKL